MTGEANMGAVVSPSQEQVAQALSVLKAEGLRLKRALVGHYFKYVEQDPSSPTQTWPVYVAVMQVDADDRLKGWYFRHTASGEFQLKGDEELQAGFLTSRCHEIVRAEFVAAFSEILTELADFADRMPVP